MWGRVRTLACGDPHGWADLGGASNLSFMCFLYFRGRSQKHKVPENGTYNWPPGLIFGAISTIFTTGAVPKAPGARRGPRGPENRSKTRGRIDHSILFFWSI